MPGPEGVTVSGDVCNEFEAKMFLLNHSSSSGGVGSGAGGVGGGDKKNKIHVFQKKGSTSQSNAADFTQVSVQCIDYCEKDCR